MNREIFIIANGNNYSAQGVYYSNNKVIIKKGSMVNPNTGKLVYKKIENLRNNILNSKVDKNFCLKFT